MKASIPNFPRVVLVALACAVGLCGSVHAKAYVWNTSVTAGNWETSGNWTVSGSPSTTSDTVSFPSGMADGTTVTVTQAHTVKSLAFANTNPMTLVLADVALGYKPASGSRYDCKIGATGSVTVDFCGTGAQLKSGASTSLGSLYFGNDEGVGTTTLRFTLAKDTQWDDSNAPILATGGDNPVFFRNSVSLVVDARTPSPAGMRTAAA